MGYIPDLTFIYEQFDFENLNRYIKLSHPPVSIYINNYQLVIKLYQNPNFFVIFARNLLGCLA